MGFDRRRYDTGTKALRIESGQLILPSEIAARIENFEETIEGSLESVRGPTPYVPTYAAGAYSYGNMHGVFHALLLGGTRDVLLCQDGPDINVHQGWEAGSATATWDTIIGPAASSPQVIQDFPDHTGPQFPCQFEATPTGIVIVPQGGRACFYDGIVALPLGYDRAPGTPIGWGPESPDNTNSNANTEGYSVRTLAGGLHAIPTDFGYGRVGTPQHNLAADGEHGILRGEYQTTYQWVDRWGNISPASPRSNIVQLAQAYSTTVPEALQHILCWANLENGPTGTIGKLVNRSKDMVNSGTTRLFTLTGNIGPSVTEFATIPDNVSRKFPDNTPDSWLISEAQDIQPVPVFKLCRLAFGRLWIANTRDDPGILIPSQPGKYGTFDVGAEMFPDASGGEITGLWTTNRGLLVFTINTTFLITPSDDGQDFRVGILHPSVGCAAPSSIANMGDGTVVWLGQDGFYAFDGESVGFISHDIKPLFQRFNRARLLQACAAYDYRSREYRCWVALDGSRENDLCMVYNGEGWKRRTDVNARAVCVTKDHRQYMLVAGQSVDSGATTNDGVWVLDHATQDYVPAARTARLETSWIEGYRSRDRRSAKTISFWMRETDDGTATVRIDRDWRTVTAVVTDTVSLELDSPEDTPPIWDTTAYGSSTTPNAWIKRRPYWRRVHIDVPSCEVYKITVTATTRMEIFGLSVHEQPSGSTARTP